MSSRTILAAAAAAVLVLAPPARADSDQGRSSQLTPAEGTSARGRVVLNPAILHVIVQGLPAGEYSVLLDDGTGAKVAIGSIAIAPRDEDDDADDGDDDGDDGGDDGDGDDGAGDDPGGDSGDEGGAPGEDGEEDDEDGGPSGHLKLAGDQLPFGAASRTELGGRAICVVDAEGVILLSGTTPNKVPHEPEAKSGRCPLSLPEPAVDEDAAGALKLESRDGRAVIKVQLGNLEPAGVYEVILTNPAGDASESLGETTADEEGSAQLKLDTAKGDALPFGAGDLAALEGYGVAVEDAADAVVLTGTVCAVATKPGGGPDDPGPSLKPRCLAAALDGAQEVPPVDTAATGTAQVSLGGREATKLHYAISVEGLSGPPIGAHIHGGAAGEEGDVIVPLDGVALAGEVEVSPEVRDAIQSGNTYVNIHTEANPEGEVRGQLAACPDDDGDDEDDGEEDEEEGEEDDAGDDGEGDGGEPGGGAALPADGDLFVMVGSYDTPFLRGDANTDQSVDVADPVFTLDYLFRGGPRPQCMDAADSNDDGAVDLSDPVGTLVYLFVSGPAPRFPGTILPGTDPTSDGLFCAER